MAADRDTDRSTDDPDQLGEQWHGAHSDPQTLREPRREPGGVQRTVDPDCGGDPRP
jgi:hypothetical protein